MKSFFSFFELISLGLIVENFPWSDHGGMTEKEIHLFFLSDISIYLS